MPRGREASSLRLKHEKSSESQSMHPRTRCGAAARRTTQPCFFRFDLRHPILYAPLEYEFLTFMSNPSNLLELLQATPGDRTAVILPEAGIRVSYDKLR